MDIVAPPSSDIVGPAGRALELYQRVARRVAPWTVPLLIAAPMALLVVLFLYIVTLATCEDGCAFFVSLLLVPAFLLVLAAFLVTLAYVGARRAVQRMRRDLVVTQAIRQQGLKDWFVRGAINDAEYQSLDTEVRRLVDPAAPHHQAQDASAFLRRLASLLCIPVAPVLGVLVISLLALTDGEVLALPLLFFFLVASFSNVVGIVAGFRYGRELQRQSLRLGIAMQRRVDDAEAELLRNANARSRGDAPRTPQPYRRASFQPFMGK